MAGTVEIREGREMIELIAKIALVLVLIVCAALETWFDGKIKGFADGFAAAREFWRPLCDGLIDENEALKRKLKEIEDGK